MSPQRQYLLEEWNSLSRAIGLLRQGQGRCGMSGFREAVEAILDRGGVKGYNNALREICRDIPHALGEIIYKAVRYHAKRDPQDLVKIAAWAKLEWDYANSKGSDRRDTAGPGPSRTVDQELIRRIAHSRAGDAGGDARGVLDEAFAKAVLRVPVNIEPLKDRVGSSGRRGKSVDSKSRRGKGKR